MPVLFIGVGNLHRADDGVGPSLAEKLSCDPEFKKQGVVAQPHSGEGASLIHLWQDVERVVIVDAMKSGLRCGTVRRFDVAKEKLNHGIFRYSSHLFSLAEAVEMSRQLGSLPKHMIIYGIEGKEFTFGAKMSPSVAKSMAKVEEAVRKECLA